MGANQKKRILVVDDEPYVCDAIRMMLHFDGHEAECVNSAQAALEMLGSNSYDIVFTDFSMPVMKGDELAQAIKRLYPKQPIVMITAYAEMLQSPLPGVDFLLSKPFLLENLRQAITNCGKPVAA